MITKERTQYQYINGVDISSYNGDDIISDTKQNPTWYQKVRVIRRDPTISLVRWLSVAPALSAGWAYQSRDDVPEGAEDLIREELEAVRFHLTRRAMLGCSDYGWQPYEKIFKMRDDNKLGILKLKDLVHDYTHIRVNKKDGAFKGFLQQSQGELYTDVRVDIDQALLFYYDVEGTNWYGNAVSRNVERPHDDSVDTRDAANRYDSKVAGAHWLIRYPIGSSIVNGVETDNYEIAQQIKTDLQSSGIMIIPNTVERDLLELNSQISADDLWKIEIISPTGISGSYFIDKLKYYETLKVRGYGFPERTILEGQYGTKAEAGEHGDFALSGVELRHQEVTMIINWHLIDQLLALNYGEQYRGSVWIKPNPLVDEKRKRLEQIYSHVLTNPNLILEERDAYDMSAIREELGIPEREDYDEDERIPVILEPVGDDNENTSIPDDTESGDINESVPSTS